MENKIARLCWNSHHWEKPSGVVGKSTDVNSFEVNPGFGPEEWIFDLTKVIDGYKYAFLQPLNIAGDKHHHQDYCIYLYAIYKGERRCVGRINHAIVIDKAEAQVALDRYVKRGWFEQMQQQLAEVGLEPNRLVENNPLLNFNLKFKPEDLELFDEIVFSKSLVPGHRYNLQNVNPAFIEFIQNHTGQQTGADISADLAAILRDDDLSESTRLALVNARVGQGEFRSNVIKTWGNGERCALTFVDIREMLVASHIKAWSECASTNERLDGANGILLCAHIDKLFDRHLITFIKTGHRYLLKMHPSLNKSQLKALGINDGDELMTSRLDLEMHARFDEYLGHHNRKFEEIGAV